EHHGEQRVTGHARPGRAGCAGAERVRVRRWIAVVDAVERRRADDAALVVLVGPVVRRTARVEPVWKRQPERRRLRLRIPAAESGPDPDGHLPGIEHGPERPDAI